MTFCIEGTTTIAQDPWLVLTATKRLSRESFSTTRMEDLQCHFAKRGLYQTKPVSFICKSQIQIGNPYLAHNILVGKDYVYAFILAAFPNQLSESPSFISVDLFILVYLKSWHEPYNTRLYIYLYFHPMAMLPSTRLLFLSAISCRRCRARHFRLSLSPLS